MNILDEKIKKSKSICILGHQNPDGDCMGAGLAIYNYIKNQYKEEKQVKIYYTEFSDRYMILPGADKISHDTNDAITYDLCIVVDCGAKERFKDFIRYFDTAKDSVVFDHHENNTLPAKVSVVDPESIATCEILCSHLLKEYINDDVAMCLYLGIATDSGVFRYKAVTSHTFELAATLLKYNFDHTKLIDDIVFDNTINQRRAQALVFNRIKMLNKGTVSYSYISDDELQSFNLKKVDIDNMIVFLREITGVKVAAFAYETGHNIYKLSLRSKEDSIDVAEFAKSHEGGGHKLASGCIYHGDIDTVSRHFESDIIEYLNGK